MPDQRVRSLRILARLEAALGGVTAVVVFALWAVAPNLLGGMALSLTAAMLGTLAAVYFATIHQVIQRKNLTDSTLVLSVLTIINFALIITSTGGLDSPFYSLWLLAIIVAGIFGLVETVSLVSITLLYFLFMLFQGGINGPYIRDHLVQLIITLATAALAEWVHRRNRASTVATHRLETLSGQLTAEQLKADAIMSNIGEGVMVVDASRRIQLFNRAAQDLTGWDESSAQNIDYTLVLQLRTDKDQPVAGANDPFAEAWNKHADVVKSDLVMMTRNGRKVQLNISISPLFDHNDQASGAIALFRDISEEKEVERQKDEFVSTASHEMRTPVAAIEGYISLAMNPNVATIDDRAKKYLEKAHDTISHLGQLFKDLLSVAKAEEDQLIGNITALNIGVLVQAVVDDMQFTVQKKNLTLVLQISDQGGKAIAPLYYVAANPERLREILMNLVDNAAKYTKEGGIKVTLAGTNKEVTVAISDSGVGIAPEDMKHLFQKFYRIDNSDTRTIGGTGLGLYLCRKVIESFNGRIWVESKPGVGSTFKFMLPRLSQAEAEKLQKDSGSLVPLPDAAAANNPSTPQTVSPAGQTAAIVTIPVNAQAAVAAPLPEVDSQTGLVVTLLDAKSAGGPPAPAAPAARAYVTDITRRVH